MKLALLVRENHSRDAAATCFENARVSFRHVEPKGLEQVQKET